jgi:hypothetical protein
MAIFDAPTRDFCEVRRQKTNTPLQALALQNDIQVLEAARVLAQNVIRDHSDETPLVRDVFQRILARTPKQEELKLLNGYYKDVLKNFSGKKDEAQKLLAVGKYKSPDTDPAKTAALMLTAQVIYNLDETITKE